MLSDAMLEYAVQARGITVKKADRERPFPVKDVSLAVRLGEAVGIVGENGSGKTTLLLAILGIITPHKGAVEILGHSCRSLAAKAAVGFAPDFLPAAPHWTARTFLHLQARLAGLSNKTAAHTCEESLEQFGLRAISRRPISGYSRGEQRRVALASALIANPQVIILDEPSASLDPDIKPVFWKRLEEARGKGASILLTSHDLREVEAVCDRSLRMAAGSILGEEEQGIDGGKIR